MDLVIAPGGQVRCIYDEVIDLHQLGTLSISRASQVEPDAQGHWSAQVIEGPTLGPFGARSDALVAEHAWLLANWLTAAR